MRTLPSGYFFGSHYSENQFEQLKITDTVYTHERVDWHRHEHPYFTFLLRGKLYEENKKEAYYLQPGNLVFHYWQDAHYNKKPPEYTRGFHIEINTEWLDKYELNLWHMEGSHQLDHPAIIREIQQLFLATKRNTSDTKLIVESALINALCHSNSPVGTQRKPAPNWVAQLKDLLHSDPTAQLDLSYISNILGVHPVHISRAFPKYFGQSFTDYLRTLRINQAFTLMSNPEYNLTNISHTCGFFDQSHFIKTIQKHHTLTPKQLVKLLHSVKQVQF